jgi:hypothetical protein
MNWRFMMFTSQAHDATNPRDVVALVEACT